jgi:hypothetical protein
VDEVRRATGQGEGQVGGAEGKVKLAEQEAGDGYVGGVGGAEGEVEGEE